MTGLQIGILVGCLVIAFVAILVVMAVSGSRRDDAWLDVSPPEDGFSGGRRGKVWSDAERAERTGKPSANVTALRVVAGACPPHEPEYDETVNETYCQKCLERLPNAKS